MIIKRDICEYCKGKVDEHNQCTSGLYQCKAINEACNSERKFTFTGYNKKKYNVDSVQLWPGFRVVITNEFANQLISELIPEQHRRDRLEHDYTASIEIGSLPCNSPAFKGMSYKVCMEISRIYGSQYKYLLTIRW